MTLTPAGPPRGLIHHDPTRARFEHARYLPATDLAAFVEHYWTVQWDLRGQAPHVQSTLPHPSVHLVLEDGHSRIVGIHRGRFTQMLEGRGGVFGVKFRPGGFHPFVPRPVSRLTGRTLDAAELFGEEVRSLEHEVFGGANHESMVAAAERFLRERLPPADPLATRAGEIVAGILADRTITRVSRVAAHTGLTERQLQRLFSRYVGVSPKWVIQRYRLHEALDRVDQGEIVDWASLAADLGYFDQPHFIRDFRRMVGQTPANYRSERTGQGQT
jgi:AraC-like DNA-binding protein